MSDESDLSEDDLMIPCSHKDHDQEGKDEAISPDFWKHRLNVRSAENFQVKPAEAILSSAISNGDIEKVREMLSNYQVSPDENLSPNFGSYGRKPIFLAAEEGQSEIVELLLDFNCRLSPEDELFTPLMAVCSSPSQDRESNLTKCVILLVEKAGQDPNSCQSQKITGLMLACKHGHEQVVRKLLQYPSIQIDAQDSQKWTGNDYIFISH